MKKDPQKEFENKDKAGIQDEDSLSKRPVPEIGGAKGPEPTRYGDWEKKGRCIDF
jgi:Uncharacterized conserved small protein